MAASYSVAAERWQAHFDDLMARVAGRFTRVESRRAARKMVAGLASELPNKNCWTLSEQAGDDTPDAMQNLLSRASWDTEGVGADLRGYVVEHLATSAALAASDPPRRRRHCSRLCRNAI
ncbi:hypothetical protein [Nocardia abscessus]|uniref:hypothetical protein n=1 Tax=Nocardia abscessus TaxID=120957 RepID=UPI003CC7E5C2